MIFRIFFFHVGSSPSDCGTRDWRVNIDSISRILEFLECIIYIRNVLPTDTKLKSFFFSGDLSCNFIALEDKVSLHKVEKLRDRIARLENTDQYECHQACGFWERGTVIWEAELVEKFQSVIFSDLWIVYHNFTESKIFLQRKLNYLTKIYIWIEFQEQLFFHNIEWIFLSYFTFYILNHENSTLFIGEIRFICDSWDCFSLVLERFNQWESHMMLKIGDQYAFFLISQ